MKHMEELLKAAFIGALENQRTLRAIYFLTFNI